MPASATDHELPQIDTGQYELSGDTKLACEAILCLSSGTQSCSILGISSIS
ncbi:TrbM/KikA/MpfK family conjugal transfer protein [Clostridium sp.]|uniref:TrbM/KikA/MpfK family conjugal transfer protein n=1 Tax=Clostridium sp. TaxID=1506 RepID=UPI00338EAC21